MKDGRNKVKVEVLQRTTEEKEEWELHKRQANAILLKLCFAYV